MKRVKTGILTLDSALTGGIPHRNMVILAGSPGTGKTTLAMEYLFNGARDGKEAGVFFTATEPEIKLKQNLREFSFFNESFVKDGLINFVDLRMMAGTKKAKLELNDPDELLNFIANTLGDIKPNRVVFDSLSAIANNIDDPNKIRQFLYNLGNLMITKNCTTFMITEVSPNKRQYSNFNVEEFITDGIIYMRQVEKKNSLLKALQIIKMRGTRHSDEEFLVNITNNGLNLMKFMDEN